VRFSETPLCGAWLIELEPISDERGHFARTFDRDVWVAHGMDPQVVQCNASVNTHAGTLRGMHLQALPHAESKLIRVARGAVFDVLVDLRQDSATYRDWYGTHLRADNGRMLYAPRGVAHGFQTLDDDTEVIYQMGAPYVAAAVTGVRWDDPALGIEWPPAPAAGRTIGERDRTWPLLDR